MQRWDRSSPGRSAPPIQPPDARSPCLVGWRDSPETVDPTRYQTRALFERRLEAVSASDWVLILTAVLVLVTGYYAWQTRQTVNEMKSARATQVMPRLVPTLAKLPGAQVLLRVVNAGAGPAFNVDVELLLEPDGEPIRYIAPVMSPGEYQDFFAPGKGPGGSEIQLAAISSVWQTLRLRGACSDALGNAHSMDESLDLDHFAKVYLAGTWVRPDDEYLKKIGDNMMAIGKGIEAIAKQLYFARRDDSNEPSDSNDLRPSGGTSDPGS